MVNSRSCLFSGAADGPLDRVSRLTSGGSCGLNVLEGGLTLERDFAADAGLAEDAGLDRGSWNGSMLLSGDSERYCGGADADLRDLDAGRADVLMRRIRRGGGRMGEEDSAPDWKTLLSSHPESSGKA